MQFRDCLGEKQDHWKGARMDTEKMFGRHRVFEEKRQGRRATQQLQQNGAVATGSAADVWRKEKFGIIL